MRDSIENLRKYEIPHPLFKVHGEGLNGFFIIPSPTDSKRPLRVLSSDGLGWDHVSVSMAGRCPNWIEMSYIKELFFTDKETVVQFHPKKIEYINNHQTCLHLWRNQSEEFLLPDSLMVGIRGKN